PGFSSMPPRLVMQNGRRTTSTRRTGSQKLTLNPTRNCDGHMQMGEPPGLGVSSCPMDTRSRPPNRMGSMQLQQISVIGFANRPVQVAVAEAGADVTPAAMANKRMNANSRKDFIDSQPFSVL